MIFIRKNRKNDKKYIKIMPKMAENSIFFRRKNNFFV